ncbi:hypothetical protein GQ42DRAFT_178635 [Ramicandelaber brevisporus]|nr:hypothetical protein GQ42DRAFT_178635 [Ramicandelaber brevisporus]
MPLPTAISSAATTTAAAAATKVLIPQPRALYFYKHLRTKQVLFFYDRNMIWDSPGKLLSQIRNAQCRHGKFRKDLWNPYLVATGFAEDQQLLDVLSLVKSREVDTSVLTRRDPDFAMLKRDQKWKAFMELEPVDRARTLCRVLTYLDAPISDVATKKSGIVTELANQLGVQLNSIITEQLERDLTKSQKSRLPENGVKLFWDDLSMKDNLDPEGLYAHEKTLQWPSSVKHYQLELVRGWNIRNPEITGQNPENQLRGPQDSRVIVD